MSAPAAAGSLVVHSRRSRHPALEVMRRLFRKPQALVGSTMVCVVVLSAIFAPILAPFHPYEQGVGDPFQPPSLKYLFGTDQYGRDVFSRVAHGGRISLQIGLLAVAIGGSIGLVMGSIAGYVSGWTDDAIMRFVDVMLAFPGILLALAVVILLGPGQYNLMIAVGIGVVPTIARVVRASVLEVKSRDYVTAARAVGAGDARILLLHILPNTMAPFIVLVTLDIAAAILAATSLSFLGIGSKPPSPEWGLMLTDARDFLRDAWWMGSFPGAAITVTVIGVNLLGDSLRDILDPRLRGTDR